MTPEDQPHTTRTPEPSSRAPVKPTEPGRAYERPQITRLGALTTITGGALGSSSDALGPGSAF